jgi:hypothetical protein
MINNKINYNDKDKLFMKRALNLAPKYSSIGRNKNKNTEISQNSWKKFDKDGYKDQYHDNSYTHSRFQKIYYSQKNKDFINLSLQKMILEKLNIKISNQNDRFLEERMHEAFHFIFEIHYQEKNVKSSNFLLKFAREGYEFNPDDNEKRGIINKSRYNKEYRNYGKNKINNSLSDMELLKKINDECLRDLYELVSEKILSWKYYNKDYNRTVYEKLYPTTFKDRPEDTGINAQRKPANANLFRVKPDMYKNNIYDLYRKKNKN